MHLAPLTIALRFVERINAHDVDGLCGLMAGDHRFTDSLGTVVAGRDTVRNGWTAYFATVPDYQLQITHRFANDSEVVLLGQARGSYASQGAVEPDSAWSTPVAIRASIRGGLVGEWQVYADNEPLREKMRRR